MQFRTISVLFIFLFLVTGCAGMTMKKWVEGDTYYSNRSPSIRIRVKQGLEFVKMKNNRKIATGTTGVQTTLAEAVKVEKAIFRNKKGHELIIKTKVFPPNANWYYHPPDYATDNMLKNYEVKVNGNRFEVGIYHWTAKNGSTYLVKKFGRLFGEKTMLELFYSEQVGSEWKNTRLLNREQEEFLKEFSKRADASFEILDYADPPANPTTSSEPVDKPADIDAALATAANEDTRAILEYIKNAGDGLDAETKAGLIQSALSSATNHNTIKILQALK
jgi:hypothetical protein